MTVADLTLRAVRGGRSAGVPWYARTLRAACRSSPPVFGAAWYGDRYRMLATDPRWVAESLLHNAAKEAQGSRELWDLAGRAKDPEVAVAVRNHAVDESRHARMYVAILDLAFPGALSPAGRYAVRGLAPRYGDRESPPRRAPLTPRRLLDALIQVNLGEIKTRVNQLLLTPILTAYAPRASRRRLMRILQALLRDETRHVAYTAHFIEQALAGGQHVFVMTTMRRRLALLNRITESEIGRAPGHRRRRGRR